MIKDDDKQLAESAGRETLAQLEIVRALKPLSRGRRQAVIEALSHLLAADACIPGLFEMIELRKK